MARCATCGGEMGLTDTTCPHCGHSIVTEEPPARLHDWAYGDLADIALATGLWASLAGACVIVLNSILSLFWGQFFQALIAGPIALAIALASAVVFARMRDIT